MHANNLKIVRVFSKQVLKRIAFIFRTLIHVFYIKYFQLLIFDLLQLLAFCSFSSNYKSALYVTVEPTPVYYESVHRAEGALPPEGNHRLR